MKRFVCLLSAFICIIACVPEQATQQETDEKASVNAIVITGDAADIAPTSVKISGTVAIVNAKEANGKAYFFISETKGDIEVLKKGKSIEAGNVAAEGNSFSVTVDNLSTSTEYFYAAAVSIDGKEFTGPIKAFTTAEKPKELTVTGAASDITEISAKLTGYANPTPEMGNVTMGIVFSTNVSPSLDNGTEVSSRELDGNNMYTVTAQGLSSNTTYYYKSFVQYGGVYRYGEVKSFKTLEVKASVETLLATDITEFKATLQGRLSVDSTNELEKSVWFIFSQSVNTLEEIKTAGEILITDLKEDGTFHYSLDNLDYDEEYCFIAVAKVHDILLYGDVIFLSTKSINATVETNEVTDITELRATLNGKLVVDSKENMSQSVWFLYCKTSASIEELKKSGETTTAILAEDGLFSCNLTNLEPDTDYVIVAVAKVHDKEFYGELSSFRTLSIKADVSIDVTQIEEFKATLNANLTLNTKESFFKMVWFLISDKEVSFEELITIGIGYEALDMGDGSYRLTINDLSYNTTYYCTAVAIIYDEAFVYNGKFYSKTCSFNTLDFNASIITGDACEGDVGTVSAQLYSYLTIEAVSPYDYFRNTNGWMLFSDSFSTLDDLITSGTRIQGTKSFCNTTYSPYTIDYSFPIQECAPNTEYCYVACANVAGKDVYGDVKCFRTKEIIVNIETGESTEVGPFSATINGTLETENIEGLSEEYYFLFADGVLDFEELKKAGKKVSTKLDGGVLSAELGDLIQGTSYSYAAYAKYNDYEFWGNIKHFSTEIIPEVVDLGLSVKWRSWNLGASSPEESGDYYAWGETETDLLGYSIGQYKWFDIYHTSHYTKYTTDDLVELEPEDDAASMILGSEWHIPTYDEWLELVNNCLWESLMIHGMTCWKATGPNGKNIYFPAAGGFEGRVLNAKNSIGIYWSSTRSLEYKGYSGTDRERAYVAMFQYSTPVINTCKRYLGVSVRPVTQ